MRSITKDELRHIIPDPVSLVVDKVLTQLDADCLHFMLLSPFVLMGTQGQNGADVSPRGDPRGFVKVVVPHTILIPDRPGNNRLDTMINVLENPRVRARSLPTEGVGFSMAASLRRCRARADNQSLKL
jgi:uncharacterized protein